MLIPKQVAAISQVAADENTTRYAINHVHVVRVSDEECRAEATDGRVAMRVTWNDKDAREHYPKQWNSLDDLPKDGAERLIPKAMWDAAMRSVQHDRRRPSLNNLFVLERGETVLLRTVDLNAGDTVTHEADADDDAKFPKIEEVILEYNQGGVEDAIEIGVNPQSVGETLLTMAKILGDKPRVRLLIPKDGEHPIFIESLDSGNFPYPVSVVACVMPCSLE